jgi:hypothetical protein
MPEHWHVDKKVPLALIIALTAQTAFGVWWASGINTRVENLERQVSGYSLTNERVIRIEGKIDSFKETLIDIKAAVRPTVVYEVPPPAHRPPAPLRKAL